VVAVGEALPFGDDSLDGVFSAYVFRNLTSVQVTLREIARVLRPGGRAVIVDLGRPRGRATAAIHRTASAVFLPLAGLIARAPADYWYLHRSLDKLAPPELLYVAPRLVVTASWRMGPLGFVHAVVLEKT
jgi:demethylmenaquinone methyltransferase/2-methoxy-6-polyprenyl-1,4-benzoquinol methylase